MKKILVPFDFSVVAHRAYQFACEIAVANDGEVHVIHVVEVKYLFGNGMPGQPYVAFDSVHTVTEISRDAEEEFRKMAEALGPAAPKVKYSIKTGSLTDLIPKTVTEENIDLVVMATSGAHGLKEFFIGSNTEKVVRASPVLVFVLPKALHLKDVRNIVLPTCLDLTQGELIKKVQAMQQFFDAIIHVLYVNNFPTSLIRDEEVEVSLNDFVKFYGLIKYTLNIRRGADLDEAIIRFAGKVPHSIIAMSTHGYQGFKHLLRGSVAEDVVNHAVEPVWTYVSQDE